MARSPYAHFRFRGREIVIPACLPILPGGIVADRIRGGQVCRLSQANPSARRRMDSTVSAPERMGFIRIIRSPRPGSLCRNVPETR